MTKVVNFEVTGKSYPLTIIDNDGRRWVTAQQLGEALGNKHYRKLLQHLRDSDEIQPGKHYSNFKSRRGDGKLTDQTILSYRGVVRVVMRSQGDRAKEFRDWAEDVLAQVMANGTYGETSEAFNDGRKKGLADGLGMAGALGRMGMSAGDIGRLIHLRRSGLTQREVGALFGCSKDKIRAIEKVLKTAGASFPVINAQARDKAYRENVGGLVVDSAPLKHAQLPLFGGEA